MRNLHKIGCSQDWMITISMMFFMKKIMQPKSTKRRDHATQVYQEKRQRCGGCVETQEETERDSWYVRTKYDTECVWENLWQTLRMTEKQPIRRNRESNWVYVIEAASYSVREKANIWYRVGYTIDLIWTMISANNCQQTSYECMMSRTSL